MKLKREQMAKQGLKFTEIKQQSVDSYSIQQMKADLMELEAVERLKIMSGLLDFFIPKLNRTDHSMTFGDDVIVVRMPETPQKAVLAEEINECVND